LEFVKDGWQAEMHMWLPFLHYFYILVIGDLLPRP